MHFFAFFGVLTEKNLIGRRSDNIDASSLPNSSSESLCPKRTCEKFLGFNQLLTPLNIYRWKVLAISFHVVFLKKYIMDPARRQNFGNALGKLSSHYLTQCLTRFLRHNFIKSIHYFQIFYISVGSFEIQFFSNFQITPLHICEQICSFLFVLHGSW